MSAGLFFCARAGRPDKVHFAAQPAARLECIVRPVHRRWLSDLRQIARAVGLAAVGVVAGCEGDEPLLTITAVPPIKAEVGREISVPLLVTQNDHPIDDGNVMWSWQPLTSPELATRPRRPTLTGYTHGRAVWRWTPIADDYGDQEIEFFATLAHAYGTTRLPLRVESGSEPPVFREPVGEGTTLDLRTSACATVTIVVESTAAPSAALSLVDPPESARIAQLTELTGELLFCPTMKQIAADTVYPLILQAESGPHVIRKSYVLVLRRPT